MCIRKLLRDLRVVRAYDAFAFVAGPGQASAPVSVNICRNTGVRDMLRLAWLSNEGLICTHPLAGTCNIKEGQQLTCSTFYIGMWILITMDG